MCWTWRVARPRFGISANSYGEVDKSTAQAVAEAGIQALTHSMLVSTNSPLSLNKALAEGGPARARSKLGKRSW